MSLPQRRPNFRKEGLRDPLALFPNPVNGPGRGLFCHGIRDGARWRAFRIGSLLAPALILASAPSGVAALQSRTSIEFQAGAAYSSPLAEGVVSVPGDVAPSVDAVELGPRIAPSMALVLATRLDRSVDVELRGGMSFGDVRGSGPDGSWDGGRLLVMNVLVGARAHAAGGVDLTGAVGKALYSGDDVQLLGEGPNTGLLMAVGAGYGIPGLDGGTVLIELQRHGFGTTPLRAAGAPDGSVLRLVAHVGFRVWGGS